MLRGIVGRKIRLVAVLRTALVGAWSCRPTRSQHSAADRATVAHLIQARGLVDVVIPRGERATIEGAVVRVPQVPLSGLASGTAMSCAKSGRPGHWPSVSC